MGGCASKPATKDGDEATTDAKEAGGSTKAKPAAAAGLQKGVTAVRNTAEEEAARKTQEAAELRAAAARPTLVARDPTLVARAAEAEEAAIRAREVADQADAAWEQKHGEAAGAGHEDFLRKTAERQKELDWPDDAVSPAERRRAEAALLEEERRLKAIEDARKKRQEFTASMRANHNAHDKFIKKTHLAKNEALAAAAMREATLEKQKGQQRAKPSWEVDDLIFEEPKFVRLDIYSDGDTSSTFSAGRASREEKKKDGRGAAQSDKYMPVQHDDPHSWRK